MKIPENKIKSLRQIFNTKAKQSSGIRLTFTAYKQGEERGTKLIEKADIKNLNSINTLLAMEKFIRVKIDVYDLEISQSKIEKTYEFTDDSLGFSGFGNTSESQQDKLQEMLNAHIQQQELLRLREENQWLKKENEELENELEAAEEVIEQLNEKVKSQKSMKTYAELAGVALDRLGLKNQVKDMLSGFLGDDENEETPNISLENLNTGIVDEPFCNEPNNPKSEMIELIVSCLSAMDTTLLGIVFSIFSEIEKRNFLGLKILAIIDKYKQNINAQKVQQNQENLQTVIDNENNQSHE
ncbi:MAG: hypothetical protein FWE63_01970 [Bacteroidales bacterium]|nr:hypothetical protein [Bacteroidales bacterium]